MRQTTREADEQDPGDRRQGSRQRRARHRRQASRGPPGAGRPAVPRPCADRGRPGHGQDRPGQGDRPQPRLLVPAHPVHAGPAALGRLGVVDLQPEDTGVRVPSGTDHEPDRARRRDQSGHPQDAVRSPRVHGGAPGHDRWHHLPDARSVPRDRHPEPDRIRGHVRPAGGPAGPVHAPAQARLSATDRGDRHPRRTEADPSTGGPRGGPDRAGPARDAGRDPRDLRRLERGRLHRPAG